MSKKRNSRNPPIQPGHGQTHGVGAGDRQPPGERPERDQLARHLVDDHLGRVHVASGRCARGIRRSPTSRAPRSPPSRRSSDRCRRRRSAARRAAARRARRRCRARAGGRGRRQSRRRWRTGVSWLSSPGRATVAVASAAMPSRRPMKPRRSMVVALTATRAGVVPRSSAMRARMASACGAMRGASASSVTSALTTRPPRAATRPAAWLRKMWLSAPFHCGSEGGKCRPISPSASAP